MSVMDKVSFSQLKQACLNTTFVEV